MRHIGRGAYADVYRVRRGAFEYALKLLRASGPDDDPLVVAFRREAALLACVNHPGLPRVYEVGTRDGRPYLLMDLVEGRRLTDLLTHGPLPEEQVVTLGISLADALAAAHASGLVHRDVKPDNIVLPTVGTARLIDFGLAMRMVTAQDDADPTDEDAEPVVAGTLAYSAPEQSGMLNRPIDGRADLYALGTVLFECATGTPPFAADDVGELLRLHAVVAAPDPRERRPELSEGLAAIIGRLLAKDPDDRYQSALNLRADLRRLADEPRDAHFALSPIDTPTGGRGEMPLVGRRTEFTRLTDRWARARAGLGGAALIHGPAGIGKSRLARELVGEALRSGHPVLTGRGTADGAQPLAPLRAAVDEYLLSVRQLPEPERRETLDRLVAAAGPVASLLTHFSPELAAVLAVPALESEIALEQFTGAVATFLTEFARSAGGAVLYLDDVQWLDDVTLAVLRQLPQLFDGTGLLVLGASRDDSENEAGLAAFRAVLGDALDTTVAPDPLTAEEIGTLVAMVSGGLTIDSGGAASLTALSDGNPLTVLEYVKAIVDAGLVLPHWGTWILDTEGLARLDLPRDAAALVAKRIDALDTESRRLLGVAAVLGHRFGVDLVVAVSEASRSQVTALLSDAVWQRLIENTGDGRYAFLHHRIREVLLGHIDPVTLRTLHDRAAHALERHGSHDPATVYALAHHCLNGDVGGDPARVFRACLAAGRLALADHAAAQAVSFLEHADTASAAASRDTDSAFLTLLGTAYHRAARFDDAVATLRAALDVTSDPVERARLLHKIARVHDSTWNTPEQVAAVNQALTELGRPLPTNPVRKVLSLLWAMLLGFLVYRTGIGRGTAHGRTRELYQVLMDLYDVHSRHYIRELQAHKVAFIGPRGLYLSHRVGLSPETARATADRALLLRSIGLTRLATRLETRAVRMAADLNDPLTAADVAWVHGVAMFNSADSGVTIREVMRDHSRWLDHGHHVDCYNMLGWDLLLRGDMAQAEDWFRRRRALVAASGQLGTVAEIPVEAGLPALRGRIAEATTILTRMRERSSAQLVERADILIASMHSALEQNELGAPFDEAVAEFESLGLSHLGILPALHSVYVFRAYGRVEQARHAPDDEWAARLEAAKKAVNALRWVTKRPLLAAHHRVLRASLHQIGGDHEAALRELAKAEPTLRAADAPLVAFEAARVRARALQALDAPGEVDRQAGYALEIAHTQGWPHRARWVKAEFNTDNGSGRSGTIVPTGSTAMSGVHRRRLAALEQVGLAASRVLDPDRLARIALDETIQILGAERAFLFLANGEEGQLVPHLGRDVDGNDLNTLTGYSATLVEQVRQSQQALVVAGTEEGEALGAQSVLVHGLRSIIIAPLRLDDRLLGVVYLDSRVAKGIFTVDDVAILTAITNHVAVALETARAAQLELAVTAVARQRDLAEKLRAAMSEMSGTLDPDAVLRRLLDTTCRTLEGGRGWLLTRDTATGGVSVLARHPEETPPALADTDGARTAGADTDETDADATGTVDAEHDTSSAPAPAPVTETDPRLAPLLHATGPLVGAPTDVWPALFLDPAGFGDPGDLDEFGDPTALDAPEGSAPPSWLAVPLWVRQELVGVLVLAAAEPDAYGPAQVETVAAIAGQGMVAYENARLFTQVRRLATVDGLTQLANRRHFLEVAVQEVKQADRHPRPLAVIMADIDHFKRINDTLGHQAGDDVIQTVAARFQANCRDTDLAGRYGGEEFVLLLPDIGNGAAAVAERLRSAVADVPVDTVAGPVNATISVGVAYLSTEDSDPATLLARADECLYRAKNSGRNRVVVDDTATPWPALAS